MIDEKVNELFKLLLLQLKLEQKDLRKVNAVHMSNLGALDGMALTFMGYYSNKIKVSSL